jgi:capsular polysaccharide transport system permease protein
MIITENSNLRTQFKVNVRIIAALLIREMLTRYGRHNLGFIWLFLEPMLFTLGVTALWVATSNLHGSSLPIIAFALTGYSSVLLWRNMPGRCIGALSSNLSLLYHRNVKVLDIYTARLILEFGGATISLVGLTLLFFGLAVLNLPENFFKVVCAWLLLAWFGSSLAILLGSLSHFNPLVDKIWQPSSYLLFPLSGAAFLVSALPNFAQHWVLYIPTVHAVELLREGWFGSEVVAIYNLGYLIFFNLFLSLSALITARWVSQRIVLET